MPECLHLGLDEVTIGTAQPRTDNLFPHFHIGQCLLPPVGHQDQRVWAQAVSALVEAAAHRVDCPGERHIRLRRHLVQRGLGRHLVKRHSLELRGTHRPHQPLHGQQCRRGGVVDSLPCPPHASYSNILSISLQGVLTSAICRSQRRVRVRGRPPPGRKDPASGLTEPPGDR